MCHTEDCKILRYLYSGIFHVHISWSKEKKKTVAVLMLVFKNATDPKTKTAVEIQEKPVFNIIMSGFTMLSNGCFLN